MPKNVTVQVGDELAAKMDKLPDVNWSQVVRGCLERYCDTRLIPDIEALVRKMKEQKEEAHKEGYKTALEWFRLESTRYEDVNRIFRKRDELETDFDRRIVEQYGSLENAEADGANPDAAWRTEVHRFWTKTIENILAELPYEYEVTAAFARGFEAGLTELKRSG